MIYYEDLELETQHRSADYFVDKQRLIEFCREWDPQPYHTSEEGAKAWGLTLSGSSTLSYAILTKLQAEMSGEKPAVIAGLGIESWRTPTPLKPNDTVHAISYVESKRESNSKPGLGIIVSVSKLLNAQDEVILEYKSSGLIMKKPAASSQQS